MISEDKYEVKLTSLVKETPSEENWINNICGL